MGFGDVVSTLAPLISTFGLLYLWRQAVKESNRKIRESNEDAVIFQLNPNFAGKKWGPKDHFLGAIDQGTSSSRFILFDKGGTAVCSAQRLFSTIVNEDHSGWAEQDPLLLLDTVKSCVSSALQNTGIIASQIKGIGITNQRETALAWDKITGEPLHNAIVWHDTRTAEIQQQLSAAHDKETIHKQCGLFFSTYFSGLKWKWMISESSRVRQAIHDNRCLFGTVDSWLIWNLTNKVHVTDVTNASRTMLMDIQKCQWSDSLLEIFGIPKSVLPEIRSSAEVYGKIENFAPLAGVPISGCLGDQQAALVGHQGFEVGDAKNTYGTGCFMLFNTGTQAVFSQQQLLTTVGYQLGPNRAPHYALEGSIGVAGAGVKFFQENLPLLHRPSDLDAFASQCSHTQGLFFVPALSGLLTPYWNPHARGTILGMSFATRTSHIARALVEATAFQTFEVLDLMKRESSVPLRGLRVDGGMTASRVLMETSADVLGIPVWRARYQEATAAGAAMAAGVGVRIFEESDEESQTSTKKETANSEEREQRFLKGFGKGFECFESNWSTEQRTQRVSMWRRAVQVTLDWAKLADHV